MAQRRDVTVFVGSLRKDSFTRKIALALAKQAPASLALEIVEIGNLSFYNQDLEANPPAPWVALRERIKRSDAVLFATPEYNRSVPGVLKNALDIASRPYGSNAWQGKPGAVISVTTGGIGAFGANHHLRQSLVFVDVPVMQQPEAYIGNVTKLLDEKGEVVNDGTRELLSKFANAFAEWIERIAPRK
ncbi:MAG TPA: NADPH-dependent FMN reductase [Planctomycetota bacterium]|nr:NADPH-dependent FMN reductase [Planctomycetota bacterium]